MAFLHSLALLLPCKCVRTHTETHTHTHTPLFGPLPHKKLLSQLSPLKHPILTSKEAQAEVEVQEASGESREDQAKRGKDTPNHHHGACPPASAQGAAHWAWKGAESTKTCPGTPKLYPTLLIGCFAWPGN